LGLRKLENQLAAELCYDAVVRAVEDYLGDCRSAGRLLDAHEHLVGPILRTGFYPQGLHGIQLFIRQDSLGQERVSTADGPELKGNLTLLRADALIERIMAPYPVRRLKRANLRAAGELSQ